MSGQARSEKTVDSFPTAHNSPSTHPLSHPLLFSNLNTRAPFCSQLSPSTKDCLSCPPVSSQCNATVGRTLPILLQLACKVVPDLQNYWKLLLLSVPFLLPFLLSFHSRWLHSIPVCSLSKGLSLVLIILNIEVS